MSSSSHARLPWQRYEFVHGFIANPDGDDVRHHYAAIWPEFGARHGSWAGWAIVFDQIDELVDEDARLMVGSSVGGGIELKATENMSIRIEGFVDHFGALDFDVSSSALAWSGDAVVDAGSNATGIATFSSATVRASAIRQFQ